MDWTKLSKSQIADFLAMYGIDSSTDTLDVARNKAQNSLERVIKQSGQVTEPVRDLYVASSLGVNNPRYTRVQIRNLKNPELHQFSELLHLNPRESNLIDHIL